ncbi:hypothetical protein ACOMHN_056828 [Nucella lapillus]
MAAPIIRRFREAMERDEDTRKMRDILGMVSKEDIMNWTDDDRLDLLHHCILHNNAEVVDFLLKQGYFVRPHEPELNPYTHLAAILGFKPTLNVLLQHRPDDFRIAQQSLFVPPELKPGVGIPKKSSSKSGDVSTNNHRVNSSMSTTSMNNSSAASRRDKRDSVVSMDDLIIDGSKPVLRTPLDVAARARHVECVKVMLSVCVLKAHPDAPSKGYLTLAALEDCPAAVNLLLETTKPDKQTTEDFKAAVEVCVQRAHPECLDLLLSKRPQNVDPKQLFKQINFFHVLYTFSATYGKGSYGRLPEVTRVLIKRGHNVNAKIPPRTYPLYTLLTHSFCFHDYSFTKHYVDCLRLLLEQGADPNFDEVQYEKRYQQRGGGKSSAAGRNAFSSALHCLLETVETYATNMASKPLAVRFVEDCAEVLASYRADASKVGVIGDGKSDLQGNVLHQYAKSCVTLGVDRSILRCILRFGAEPDMKVNGKYALNVYFDKLFELLSRCEVVDTGHKYEDDVNGIQRFLCPYMSSAHIREAAKIFTQSHGRSRSQQVLIDSLFLLFVLCSMVKYYIDKVQASLERRSKQVRPLQGLAAWRVWQVCGKRAAVVRNLPVKVELKTMILPLL